jgi:hypothetical protein
MSAPAAKAFSEPVMTMQRTFSFSSAAFRALESSPRSCVLSAFMASGRFSVMSAIWSSTSTISVS